MSKTTRIATEEHSTSQLRDKMICDTEHYLNDTGLLSTGMNSTAWSNLHEERDPVESAQQHHGPEEPHHSRFGTYVEVAGNEHGHLDDFLVCKLRLQLQWLLLRAQEGDIVLDITQVRSVASSFSQLVDEISHDLAGQGRQMLLFNERIGLSDNVLGTGV